MLKSSSIISTVIQEISQQCLIKGLHVSDALAAFMIRAVLLFPENDFNMEDNITKQQMDKIIQLSVVRLTDSDSASLDTIRLQLYFDEHFVDFDAYTIEATKNMDCRLKPLLTEIVSSEADTCKSQECLYYKVAAFIIIKSSLGDYNDPAVIAETIECLNYVLPISDIVTFVDLSAKKKERFLCELLLMVSGARIFSHEQHGNGAGIENVGLLMQTKVPEMQNKVVVQTNMVYKELDYLLNFLEFYRGTVRDLPVLLSKHLTDALINACQRILYLKIVKKHLDTSFKEAGELMEQHRTQVQELADELLRNPNMPQHLLYSQFSSLGVKRSKVQTLYDYSRHLQEIWKNIEEYKEKNVKLLKSEELRKYVKMMANHTVSPSNHVLEAYKKKFSRLKEVNQEDLYIIYPEKTSNFKRISIQYRGFCCWTLVVRDRVLIPGNTKLGLVCYKGLCYAFTSEHAAQDFISDPMMYIRGVAHLARVNPELIHLLRLYRDTASLLPYQQKSAKEMASLVKPILKKSDSSQTETHPVKSNVVHSYEWNEWQLRRLAIELTNLRGKRTHSTQTKLSTLRKDISTQVYTNKSTETQTKIDSYTNVPKPQIFLAGLRGANTKYETVDLTLRDDQDYEEEEEKDDEETKKAMKSVTEESVSAVKKYDAEFKRWTHNLDYDYDENEPDGEDDEKDEDNEPKGEKEGKDKKVNGEEEDMSKTTYTVDSKTQQYSVTLLLENPFVE